MRKPKIKAAKASSKKVKMGKKLRPLQAKKAAAKKSSKKATSKRKTKPQFAFNWHDLMTPDVEGAKRFYKALVGWHTEPQGPEYHVLMAGGQGMGGIMAQPAQMNGTPAFWSGYIMVNNVDKHCAAIKKAGGAVHREPWDIPGTLRMAIVSEPSGAVFNVYQPLMRGAMKPIKRGTLGTVGWNELITSDVAASTTFYAKLFGWDRGGVHDMGPVFGNYQLMKVKSKDHAGMMKRPDFVPRDHWGFYFYVDGIDKAGARIALNGGKITNGPHQVPTGSWIIQGQDPQGAHFSLMSETK